LSKFNSPDSGNLIKFNRQHTPFAIGFTFVEALVATAILFVVAASTAHLFSSFSSSFLSSRQRDSIQNLINNDLSKVRQLVKEYCRIQDPNSSQNSSALTDCPGSRPSQDTSGAYNPDDSLNGDCDQNTLAVAMVSANSTQFPNSIQVNTTDSSVRLNNVAITRTLNAEGNELLVSYITSANGRELAKTTTTLVPPAIGWCP
jgi:type II secretory pathway pseudopilin PulG